MAGTMAFYNGMMPGLTEMVKSISGDEAARKGYRQAAQAEHDISSARKNNVEAQVKQNEYADTDKNAMSYVLGQHGLTAPDFQTYQRHVNGTLNPGEQQRTYTPEESAKYNAALRDYGAFKTGKFHDVSQGATQFAQLPAVQGSVQAAQDYSKTPGRTAEEIIRMNQGAMGKDVLKPNELPNEVQVANWYAGAPASARQAFDTVQASKRSPGVSVNNYPGGFQEVVGPDGKPHVVQVGKDGDKRDIGVVPKPAPTLSQIIAERAAGLSKTGQPAAPLATPPSAQPQAPAQGQAQPAPAMNQRKAGAIYNTPKGPLKWSGTGWTQP